MERKFSYSEFIQGLLVGLAVGVIGGVVLTPQSGEETRRRLAGKAGDIRLSAQDFIDSAKGNLEEAVNRLEDVFGLQEKTLQRKLTALRNELEKYNLTNNNVAGG